MAVPGLPEIIRVTAANLSLSITDAQVNRIAAKAKQAERRGRDMMLGVLEVEISALQRHAFERLVAQKRGELAALERRLAELPE